MTLSYLFLCKIVPAVAGQFCCVSNPRLSWFDKKGPDHDQKEVSHAQYV